MNRPLLEREFAPLQQPLRRWGEVLLIYLVFFAAAGDPAPNVNESHYLCRSKHFWNPDWCQGDLFLDSTDTQLLFIWLFGWTTKFLTLTAAAWLGRLLVWTMLAWAWQRLSWRLAPRPLAAVLSAALFVTLNNIAHLAGEWVVGGVETKCFAYALVLLALRELIDSRWNRLWLLLGAASAFHPLVGGWSALVCGGIWFIEDRRVIALRSVLPGLFIGALLALAGILPALALTWNEPADVVAEANVIYVFERLPHHLALLHLPESELFVRLVRHGALLGVLGAFMCAVKKDCKLQNENSKLQIDALALRRIALFAWGAALLAVIGFSIELTLWNYPESAASLLKYYWFRLTDVAAALAVALYAVAIIADGIDRRRWWSVWLLAAAIGLAGSHLISLSIARYSDPVPPADRKMRDFAAWVDACDWIAANTPPGAQFLTPRMASSFKWRTGRPEVVTFKDVPQDARSIVEWYRRLRDVYYLESDGESSALRSLGILPRTRIQQIIDEYKIDYIVTEGDVRLAFPVAYPTSGSGASEEYVIYQVNGRSADDGR